VFHKTSRDSRSPFEVADRKRETGLESQIKPLRGAVQLAESPVAKTVPDRFAIDRSWLQSIASPLESMSRAGLTLRKWNKTP